MDFNTIQSLQETYLSIYETPASQSTVDKIKNAEDSKPQSTSTTPPAAAAPPTAAKPPAPSAPATTPTTTPTPATPVRRTLNDPAELERLRGAAALKSLGDSPLGKRLLAGKGRNQRSNEIVSKSIERSGLKRDELVKASPERYGKMVDFASKTNDERAEIGRQAGQAMAGALAPKLPNAEKPKTGEDKPKMDDFAAGGGNAKMKATGMTRDQVIALGKKNLANKPTTSQQTKGNTEAPKASNVTTTQSTTPPPKSDTGSLSKEQQALYDRAYSNRGNPFGRGQIQSAISKMTPEQRRQFQAYARQKGHENDWSGYKFESYVLEYLVAEGYADTDKAALAIMASMGEEWRQSIISEVAGLIPLAGLAGTVIKKVRDWGNSPYTGPDDRLRDAPTGMSPEERKRRSNTNPVTGRKNKPL